jgi:hypothetical protein
LAIGAARSTGRFEIVRKSTYASYAEVYRKGLKSKQASALASAADTLYGSVVTQSAGLFQVAVQQATDRAKAQMVSTLTDLIDVSV